MKKYNFNSDMKYKLTNNNFYAYSIIDNSFLLGNISDEEKKDLITELSESFVKLNNNDKLTNMRNINHQQYHNLDIAFLKNVDKRYEEKANKILNYYNSIDSYKLLKDDNLGVIKSKKIIKNINLDINKLKKEIYDDLITIISYGDKLENNIDISKIEKDNSLGILIKNKYQALKVYSSSMDLNDINFEMKHQYKRLIMIKELENIISKYKNIKTIYNKNNTKTLINNLYLLISDYIYILTDSEFLYTKEAIKKILCYEYDFLDNYFPTYQIILNRIWNMVLDDSDNYFCYVVCDLELENNSFYILNKDNIESYPSSGYICQFPKNFLLLSKIDKLDFINLPLPSAIKSNYEFKLNLNNDLIKIKGIYTTDNNKKFDSPLPIIYLEVKK